jgi:O-antigen/teichoic acid export membrane protein
MSVELQAGPAPVEPLRTSAGATGSASVGTHYPRYSTANFLVLLAGLISFPVMTRLLDNAQYGILGYYETCLGLIVAVAKFGSQHSVLRFYPHDGDFSRLQHFATNLVLFPLVLSFSLWALAAVGLAIGQATGSGFPAVFWCAVLLIPLLVMSSLMDVVLQASERSLMLSVTRICKRWLELVMILAAVIFIQRSAVAAYSGKLVAASLLLAFYVGWLYRNMSFSLATLDPAAIRASMLYGLPLVANEVASVLLGSIDRVMIKHLMGDFAAVGVYTIGYSLAMNVSLFMNTTIKEAFVPVANRLYGAGDDTAVRALKERILLPTTYAAFGLAALIWAVGPEALVALSGPGKAGSGPVFAIIGVSFALYPMIDISTYGLLLRKRSMLVVATNLGAALLNIGLNLVLIPAYGVMGAVWASVASLGALLACNCLLCPPELLRFPSLRAMTIAGACAAVLLAAIKAGNLFGLDNPWWRLFAATWLVLALYVAPVWLLDARLRAAFHGWRRELSR